MPSSVPPAPVAVDSIFDLGFSAPSPTDRLEAASGQILDTVDALQRHLRSSLDTQVSAVTAPAASLRGVVSDALREREQSVRAVVDGLSSDIDGAVASGLASLYEIGSAAGLTMPSASIGESVANQPLRDAPAAASRLAHPVMVRAASGAYEICNDIDCIIPCARPGVGERPVSGLSHVDCIACCVPTAEIDPVSGSPRRRCVNTTRADCLALGGTVRGSLLCATEYGYCDEPVPAGEPTWCCLPETSGGTSGRCRQMVETECAALGGTMHADEASCRAACGTGPPPPPPDTLPTDVACCLPDGSCRIVRIDRIYDDCIVSGGVPQGVGTDCRACDVVPPPPPPPPSRVACCLPDGTCAQMDDPAECRSRGGVVIVGTDSCGTVVCPRVERVACCLPDGTCIDVSSVAACDSVSGTSQINITCADVTCRAPGPPPPPPPPPTGVACCIGGLCRIVGSETECLAYGGRPVLGRSDCTAVDCSEPAPDYDVACCLKTGQCTVMRRSLCDSLGGAPFQRMDECQDYCAGSPPPPVPTPGPGACCPAPGPDCKHPVHVKLCPEDPVCPPMWRGWYDCAQRRCVITAPDEGLDATGLQLVIESDCITDVIAEMRQYCGTASAGSSPAGPVAGSAGSFAASGPAGGITCDAPPSPAQPTPTGWVDWDAMPTCAQVVAQDIDLGAPSSGLVGALTGLLSAQGLPITQLFARPIERIVSQIGQIIVHASSHVTTALQRWIGQTGCLSDKYVTLVGASMAIGTIERWVSDVPDSVQAAIRYQMNVACQYLLPSTVEARAAWLAGAIDDQTYECWVKANGQYWRPEQLLAESQRRKLDTLDTVTLYRRGHIDAETYERRIRELGFLRAGDPDEIFHLTDQIPPLSDLMRFLVRDVADDNLARRFGTDDHFDAKWAGNVKQWAYEQGIGDDYGAAAWRAHWRIPSYTQLTTMYHRLRHRPVGDPLRVPIEDVRDAIIQDDMLPFWTPKLIEIAFRPLGRIDARRAYEIGAIDDERLSQSWRDQGYSDANAATLTEYTRRQRRDSYTRNAQGRAYRAGVMGAAEWRAEMTERGLPVAEQDAILARLDRMVAQDRRKRCMASYRRRMLAGDIAADDAVDLLTAEGLDQTHARQIVDGWVCERTARDKRASIAQLCRWFERAVIDRAEFRRRLTILGWTDDDATRLIDDCATAQAERLRREQERREKADRAEEERERKRREAEERKRQREASGAARRDKALADLAERRRVRTAKCVERLSDRTGTDPDTAADIVAGTIRRLRDLLGLGVDEAIVAVCQASGDDSYDSVETFQALAASYGQGLAGMGDLAT